MLLSIARTVTEHVHHQHNQRRDDGGRRARVGLGDCVRLAESAHQGAALSVCLSVCLNSSRFQVMDFGGREISTIRYHDGFLGQRIGPVSSLALHPRLLLLAGGATDSIISIYSGRLPAPTH
jgi:hypothetical protein